MSELPNGWALATLADLGGWSGGGTPSKSKPEFWAEGTIPWVSPKDMKVDLIRDTEDHITEAAVSASATNIVPTGSVLVVTRSGILRRTLPVAVTAAPVALNQDLKALKPADGIDPRYVAWGLRMGEQSILDECAKDGTTVDSIDFPELLRRRLPLPPSAEQQRIVAAIETELSRVDAGVAALERVAENLKRLRGAVLQAAVLGRLPIGPIESLPDRSWSNPHPPQSRRAGRLWGSGTVPQLTDDERASIPDHWQWVKVSNLSADPEATVQVGPMSMRSADFGEAGVPVLNVGSVQWDSIDQTKLNHLPEDVANAFARYRIVPGDVLFTRSGTVGRCAIASERMNGWLMTFHLLRVRVDSSKCLPGYLRMVFEGAPHVRRQARGAAVGTTRAGFNTRLLADLDIPLPPIAEQLAIVEAANLCLSQMATLDLDHLRWRFMRLRRSILITAFDGKLAPQDSDDEPASALLERIGSEGAASDGHRATTNGARRTKVKA